MTVNETRLDIYRQGFTIVEHSVLDPTNNEVKVEIVIMKADTDGLRFEFRMYALPEALNLSNEDSYITLLRNTTTTIGSMIIKRHAQNINTCQHKEVMIGSNKACKHCMGNFGTRMTMDLTNN